MRLRGGMVKDQGRVTAEIGRIKAVGHEQEDVDVVRVDRARDERSEDHESRHVANRVRYAMYACKTEGQRLPAVGANPEAVQDLAEGR